LTIVGLIGGLVLTFYVMAKAAGAYEQARRARAGHQPVELERNDDES
jgi:hypothetical protein